MAEMKPAKKAHKAFHKELNKLVKAARKDIRYDKLEAKKEKKK